MIVNWKRKLSSRKLWAALAAVITSVLILFGVKDITVAQVTAVVGAFAALMTYIFAESSIDKARVQGGAESGTE